MSHDESPTLGVPELREHSEEMVATIRVTTTPDMIGQTIGNILPEVWGHIVGSGIKPIGPPMVRYHRFGDIVDLEGGFAVESSGTDTDRVHFTTLPACHVASLWHGGPYDTLGASWEKLGNWIRQQELTATEPCWEVYWTDPREVENPADWRTEILWAVQ